MRLGIRTKLVVLLVAVALLPLLAALLTIVVGGRHLRREIFGKSLLSLVTNEAGIMKAELVKDIDHFNEHLHSRPVLEHLQSAKKLYNKKELTEIDRQWGLMPITKGLLHSILNNETADVLRIIMQDNDILVEVLVTDRFGQLVAATGRTTDYYQGDEKWWQQCYNDGKGQIFIPRINYDRSAKAWGFDICIPILKDGKVLGIAKVVMDMNRWLPDCSIDFGEDEADLMVVGEEGFIMHSRDILVGLANPATTQISDWEEIVSTGPRGAWQPISDGTVRAYASVQMPSEIDNLPVLVSPWILVGQMARSTVQQGLARLSLMMLLIGLICISALFIGGVLLIDRTLINRIRKIGESARQVSAGELQHRADSKWAGTRVFGTDEIDDLARDFNNMVRKLQRSHSELTEANLLKEDFIRIAGHELRTPVSYIVGMATLMKNCDDVERLNKAISTMGFKAGRLDEIIQAMFKLIPEQDLAEGMNYSEVNLSKMLERVYMDCKPWIERRNQRLVIEPGQQDVILQADKMKLRDIIENIVMNAIKFTPNEGQINISVQRRLGGHVAIQISDQGPGIPESDKAHVFEPFYGGSDTLKHSTGKSGYGKRGMGLGLAIVKHFVDMHKGTVDFITSPNGTTFTIQLPIEGPMHNNHNA